MAHPQSRLLHRYHYLAQAVALLGLAVAAGCTTPDFACGAGSPCDDAKGGVDAGAPDAAPTLDSAVPDEAGEGDEPRQAVDASRAFDAAPDAPSAPDAAPDAARDAESAVPEQPDAWLPEPGPMRFTSISAGYYHTCVGTNHGTVYCWGGGFKGSLGRYEHACGPEVNGYVTCPEPEPVDPIVDAIAVGAGEYASCALRATGQVACWGDNANGQLGNGTLTSSSSKPVTVLTPAGELINQDALQVTGDFSCARDRSTKQLSCWGRNNFGGFGNEEFVQPSSTLAVPAALGLTPRAFAGKNQHMCAITGERSVACWGFNSFDQLGAKGTEFPRSGSAKPVSRSFAADVVSVAAGDRHSCALLADGEAYCWGRATGGMRGDGRSDLSLYPHCECSPTPTKLDQSQLEGGTITSIALGSAFGCATVSLGDSRRVACWGANYAGTTGQPLSERATWQPKLLGLQGVQKISGGVEHACAIVEDAQGSQVWCWGRNTFGQLGVLPADTEISEAPLRVRFPDDAEAAE